MKLKKMVSLLLSAVMLLTTPVPVAKAAPVADQVPPEPAAVTNLVPTEPPEKTANYVCTWNIQDWVAWHESSNKRDVVDPKHLFNKETGWVSTMYPQSRGDLIFLLDDGWDLPYGTEKNGKNKEYFGSQVLPDDKFPKEEWGDTPQEKLKTLEEEVKNNGWKGTGLWICAQTSSAYKEYEGKNEEEFWRMRLQWSKYAGISYWKIDWGTEQKKITWRRNISQWAKEEYPELIIEHVVGGRGKNTNNERMEEDLLADNIEFAAFSDVFRTYDVLDNLATAITLDRVGEQLIGGYTETGNDLGLMNAEDELYMCASLGLTTGVMRFTPYLTTDSKNSGDAYFGMGTEKDTYFAGGKKFVDTKATRNRLDEVARMLRWQRIAPAYTVGDYDTALSNSYIQDDWTFSSNEPAWDGTKNKLSQKAPASVARGIALPEVTVDSGDDIPFLTASRNPNGAISIAAYARTHTNTGYKPVKSAKVTLNAGDLTGKIGVFGYYGSLSLTFNQDLSGKKIYAQDILATQAQDITSEVQINGNTLTIDGTLLEEIGRSAGTEGDSSEPGLVLQIGEESDFAAAPKTNDPIERWGVNNGSFEKFNYDANNGQTMESVTGADWHRGNNTAASYISEGGHSGEYSGIHTSDSNYEVSTYQLNKSVANGVYKASCYVKASEHSLPAPGGNHKTSAGFYALNYGGSQYVDIQKMGALNDWTYIEIPQFNVTNGQIQIEFYSNAASGEYLIFDDVQVDYVGELTQEIDANVILEFDFSKANTDENGTTVCGSANGKEVTAAAQNVTIKTDEDGNDIAVFQEGTDHAATGITYIPDDNDPMKSLESGNGATIAMWIKTGQETFSSSLFAYGSRKDGGTGDLGASIQILGRNHINGDTVFYRNATGSTGGHKVGKNGDPYVANTWQLLTFVENGDGSGTLYIDGVERGNCGASDKTLLGFATDGNKPDQYYFGFLPYVSSTDTHFTGAMDSITVYDKALTETQVQRLYKERFEVQTKAVLNANGDGMIGGGATLESTDGKGYVTGIGKGSDEIDEEEGTVTFRFNGKEAAEWNMDIYYLSKADDNEGTGANIRDFVVTINNDTANPKTVTCPEGNSWNDTNAASVITLDKISLNKGKNTLVFGNPDGNAPSLVKVVLTRTDYAAAAEVEELIMSQLGTVDDIAQLGIVQQIRKKYDALTEEEKKLVSNEAYKMLLSAEDFMQGFLDQEAADAVINAIEAIDEEITLENEAEITAARKAYEELTEAQKLLVTQGILDKLASAEKQLDDLLNPGPQEPNIVLDSGWEVENPTEGKLVINEDGSITITTEGGTIDGKEGMKNILYYKLPNQTDYDFTVKVNGSFTADYHGAHLMITSGKNRENAVGVVRRYHDYLKGKYGTNLLMGLMQNTSSNNEYYEGAPDIGDEFYLRMEKRNGRIYGYYAQNYSDNTQDWEQIIDTSGGGYTELIDKGNALIEPENIYLAIAAANGGGKTPASITFSDLRIGGEPVPLGINSSALASVVLSGEGKMGIGTQHAQTLTLAGTDYDGKEITEFDKIAYTSSDEEVATVNEEGVVTGIRNGNVRITAEAALGGATKTASLAIQVGDIEAEETWELSSPDGSIKMTVEMITGGVLQYTAQKNGVENIGTSPLGLVTSLGDFTKGLVLREASEVKEISESYPMLSGKRDEYTNHCNEQTLTFTKGNDDSVSVDLIIRAYDDGTAYRYAVRTDETEEIRISDEASGLQLPKEADVYWMDYINGTWNYEGQYQVTTTEGLATGATPSMPFLYGKDGVWTLFSEADLNGTYSGSMLKVKENGMLDVSFSKTQSGSVVTTTPFKSPWRAAITGTPKDIVENTMIENLSTPADYDTYDYESWVDPGLSSWSWVANWGSGISDQTKASTHLNWIEFGAEIGWDYYILDENWNQGGRGKVSGMRDWWPEVRDFAKEKDVKLWAWVHVSDIDTQEERDRHFKEWSEQGIVGIKPDFFDGEAQKNMQLYDDLYKDAARYKLMLLVHGANKPTGEIRTYPNVYGREAIRGQESGGITAEQYTMIPFIRAAIGPAEVTEEIRSKDYNKTTMGFQFALTALVEDGIHSMGSAPDVYRSIPEGISYYKNYPDKWNETEFVNGEVGEYLSIARRAGTNWYVSGIRVEPGTLEVPLEYLDDGKTYTVLLYKENGRRDIDMEVIPNVTKETILQIETLTGGGYALRAIPKEEVNGITSIVQNPTEVTIEKGHLSDPVTVTLSPENAEFKDINWSVTDETIATVDQNGVIRGVAQGETTVTVASAYDETVKAEIKVTVTPARYVLDEQKWTILKSTDKYVINHTNSATITTETGVLGTKNWKNMFAMDVPKGDEDFTVTAKISGGLNANYQGGFLTVFDKANPDSESVAAGRRHHSYLMGNHPQALGVMSTASGSTAEYYCNDDKYEDDIFIKIEKVGDRFICSYSYDNETWSAITNKGTAQTTTNAKLAAKENLCIGFYAGSGGGETPIDITISDVTYNGMNVPIAIDTLEQKLDKSALLDALNRSDQKDNPANTSEQLWKEHEYTQYTRKSWNAFTVVQEKSRKVYNNDPKVPTQIEINIAASELNGAIAALLPYNICDERKPLEEVIAQAKEYKNVPKQYTEESFKELQDKIELAQERLKDESLTFLARDGMIKDLETAIANLKLIAQDAAQAAVQAAKEAAEAANSARVDAAKTKEDAAAAADAAEIAAQEAAKAVTEAGKAAEESAKAKREADKAKAEADKALQEAGRSEIARLAAQAAQEKAKEAQTMAEAAKEKTEEVQKKAEEAQGKAEASKEAAQEAQEEAKAAQRASETASTAAGSAQRAAEGAKDDAQAAQAKAEAAKDEAVNAKEDAAAARTAAEAAKAQAEEAKAGAIAAQRAAESAKADAIAAQTAAQSAKADAIAAKTAAEAAAKAAQESAAEAQKAKEEAQKAAADAATKKKDAEEAKLAAQKAQTAAENAMRAAQAAQAAAEEKQLELNKANQELAEERSKSKKDSDAIDLIGRSIKIKSAKGRKSSMKITLTKDKVAIGYQIKYSYNKHFKGKTVTKTTKHTSYTIKSLKKKTYYVKARGYTTNSKGKKVYSKWSTIKKVVVR